MVMVQLKDMSHEIGYFIFIFLTKIGLFSFVIDNDFIIYLDCYTTRFIDNSTSLIHSDKLLDTTCVILGYQCYIILTNEGVLHRNV